MADYYGRGREAGYPGPFPQILVCVAKALLNVHLILEFLRAGERQGYRNAMLARGQAEKSGGSVPRSALDPSAGLLRRPVETNV
jgi:hypothetical protein